MQGDREVLDDARSQPGQVSAQDLTAVSKDASFAANIAFYADVETDLSLLQARLLANGDRSAPRIAAAAGNAASAVKRVHDLHEKDGVPSVSYLETARLTIDQAFQPLTLYQAQLRSGG